MGKDRRNVQNDIEKAKKALGIVSEPVKEQKADKPKEEENPKQQETTA